MKLFFRWKENIRDDDDDEKEISLNGLLYLDLFSQFIYRTVTAAIKYNSNHRNG